MVDDSAVIRHLVTIALGSDPGIEVVGTAPDGQVAIEETRRLMPDAITLDVEMPVLDGLGALRVIREEQPRLPVIMFSTVTEKGAAKTLEALSLGASDYVTKPSQVGSIQESVRSVRDQLVPKIKALCGIRAVAAGVPRTQHVPLVLPDGPAAPLQRVDVLAIGCSTGGPDALAHLVSVLPADLPVPVVVVQHMPPVFTKMFAERLDKASPLQVHEAVDGQPLLPGHVLIAPGDFHLRVVRDTGTVFAALDAGPAENFCRPAVDALFRSVSEVYAARGVGIVLTGMGQDGLIGCELLRSVGAEVLVQDEESSVVWGMPGAVANAGLAHAVVPLSGLAARIGESVARDR